MAEPEPRTIIRYGFTHNWERLFSGRVMHLVRYDTMKAVCNTKCGGDNPYWVSMRSNDWISIGKSQCPKCNQWLIDHGDVECREE